jgi:hypothetical protein
MCAERIMRACALLYHDTYLSAYGINNIAKEKYDLNNMYK